MSNVALIVLALARFASSNGDEPFHDLSFDAALKKAAAEKKLVMIDFFTTWCPPCKQLDKVTWKDADVREWLAEHAVALKIDAEKEEKLAERYKIEAYPTLLFLRPDGKEADRLVGYRDPAKFLEEAALVLAGKSTRQAVEDAATSRPDDVEARYRRGTARQQKGDLDGALEDLLFFWDRGSSGSGAMSGVRVSFLMTNLQDLAQKHPPARKALVDRRDALARKLRADGPVDAESAYDFAVLGARGLKDLAGVIAMLKELRPRSDRAVARDQIVQVIVDDVVRSRLCAEVPEVLPKLRASAISKLDSTEMLYGRGLGNSLPKDVIQQMVRSTIDRTLPYFELLLDAGRGDDAAVVAARLVKFDDGDATVSVLADVVAKRGASASDLLARSEGKLAEEDRTRVARVIVALSAAASKPASAPAGGSER